MCLIESCGSAHSPAGACTVASCWRPRAACYCTCRQYLPGCAPQLLSGPLRCCPCLSCKQHEEPPWLRVSAADSWQHLFVQHCGRHTLSLRQDTARLLYRMSAARPAGQLLQFMLKQRQSKERSSRKPSRTNQHCSQPYQGPLDNCCAAPSTKVALQATLRLPCAASFPFCEGSWKAAGRT